MIKRFSKVPSILFTGSLFDQQKLHSLRSFCSLYFHGHSVGGTNPSLLEAIAAQALIAAHDNPFNKAVLGTDAYYFSSAADVKNIILSFPGNKTNEQWFSITSKRSSSNITGKRSLTNTRILSSMLP